MVWVLYSFRTTQRRIKSQNQEVFQECNKKLKFAKYMYLGEFTVAAAAHLDETSVFGVVFEVLRELTHVFRAFFFSK